MLFPSASSAASDSGSPGSPISESPNFSSHSMAGLLQGRPIGGPSYATSTGLGTAGLTTLSPDMSAYAAAMQPNPLTWFSPQSMAAAASLAAGGKLASPPATALSQQPSKHQHPCPLCTLYPPPSSSSFSQQLATKTGLYSLLYSIEMDLTNS